MTKWWMIRAGDKNELIPVWIEKKYRFHWLATIGKS